MKRNFRIVLIAAILWLAINLIPFKTGPTVTGICGTEHLQYTLSVFGVPYGYLQSTTHTGCEFNVLKPGRSIFKVPNNTLAYDDYYFKTSAFVADAAIGGAIIAIVLIVLKSKQ